VLTPSAEQRAAGTITAPRDNAAAFVRGLQQEPEISLGL